MLLLSDIIESYFLSRKNSVKSPDQVEYELHWEGNCVKLRDDINNRTYQPTAYSFIVTNPKPREIFASDFSTRILHHYLHERLVPLLENRLSKHTFNNRKGMGTSACQDAVISDMYEVSNGYTEDAWVIKMDLSGCFPNINQNIAFNQLEALIKEDYNGKDKDDMLYILRICVFSFPTLHSKYIGDREFQKFISPEKSIITKPLGVGAAIGHLIWQMAVTYYFNDIILWLESLGIHVNVYVDDWYFVVKNKTAFLTYVVPEMRRRLAEIGATLNEKKFYCQHVSKGCECLGIHIKKQRIYPNSRIINRAVKRAKELNKCVRVGKIERVLQTINSYLGICKNTCGYNQALKIVCTLSEDWKKYIVFNSHRCCLEALPEYSYRNRVIIKHKLYEKRRKRRAAPSGKRAAIRTVIRNGEVGRSRIKMR